MDMVPPAADIRRALGHGHTTPPRPTGLERVRGHFRVVAIYCHIASDDRITIPSTSPADYGAPHTGAAATRGLGARRATCNIRWLRA